MTMTINVGDYVLVTMPKRLSRTLGSYYAGINGKIGRITTIFDNRYYINDAKGYYLLRGELKLITDFKYVDIKEVT